MNSASAPSHSELGGGIPLLDDSGAVVTDSPPVSALAPEPGASVADLAEAVPEARVWAAELTEAELLEVYERAGVPVAWRPALSAIAWCESRMSPGAVGDGGNSLGLHQLWQGWAREGEDLMDPVTNARVAARVRETRGRFGGAGGWSCADWLGIE